MDVPSVQTFSEKKQHATMNLACSSRASVPETTPKTITQTIIAFANDLCPASSAFLIPVIPDDYGLYGWCSDGVLEKIKYDAGTIIFGWAIWEWPRVMLTAELHAVWESPRGDLIDITPKPQRETNIVFVPDRSYPADFDFDSRPRNRRRTLQIADDPTSAVTTMIGRMKIAQKTYETQRAEKKGKTLEEWLLAKRPIDPLPALVDELILVCGRKDEALDAIPGNGFVRPTPEYLAASMRSVELIKQIDALTRS